MVITSNLLERWDASKPKSLPIRIVNRFAKETNPKAAVWFFADRGIWYLQEMTIEIYVVNLSSERPNFRTTVSSTLVQSMGGEDLNVGKYKLRVQKAYSRTDEAIKRSWYCGFCKERKERKTFATQPRTTINPN